MATVTSVAWPATNDGQEPTPGRRFVRFSLEVSALGQSVSPTSPAPDPRRRPALGRHVAPAVALLHRRRAPGRHRLERRCRLLHGNRPERHPRRRPRAQRRHLLPELRPVDAAPGAPVARRPLPRPDRDDASPAPRRDRPRSRCPILPTASPARPPSPCRARRSASSRRRGTTLSPSPDQAVLSVVLDGEFPNDPNDPTGSGHYLGCDDAVAGQPAQLHPERRQRGPRHDQRRRRHDRQGQLRRRALRRHLLVPRPGHADLRDPRGRRRAPSPVPSSPSTRPSRAPPPSTSAPRPPWPSASRPRWPRPPRAPRRGSASPIRRRARRSSSAPGSHGSGGSSGLRACRSAVAIVILLVVAARRRALRALAPIRPGSRPPPSVPMHPLGRPVRRRLAAAPVVPVAQARKGAIPTPPRTSPTRPASRMWPSRVRRRRRRIRARRADAGATFAAGSSAERAAPTKAVNVVGPASSSGSRRTPVACSRRS